MPLILRGFGELTNNVIQIGKRGASAIAVRMFAAGNALYESLTGVPASGATRRDIRAHDHTPGNGIVIPRGSVYSFDVGEDLSASSAWSVAIAIADMGSYFAILDRSPNLKIFVTPGIDENTTAVSGSACTLEAKILVDVDLTGGGSSVDFRFYNRNTGTYSAAQNATALQWISFGDIPIEGGVWNDLDIEIQGNGGAGSAIARVSIFSFNLAETYGRSQPESNGNYLYNNPSAPRP